MRCPDCDFETPGDAVRFCGGCGRPLPAACPSCGSHNPARFHFCSRCGTPLPQEAPPGSAPPARAAMRRQLTVLFCDVVSSTELAQKLDPEVWREVVRAYQESCREVILQHGGTVAQYLGDGILVYFGYPVALENAPESAARAGMALLGAVGVLNQRLQAERGIRLAVRVAAHTGMVVVGELGGGAQRQELAVGQTIHLASRLQGLAAPDSLVISADTRQLLGELVEVEELGSRALKGFVSPVPAFRVRRVHEASAGRLRGIRGQVTPLVGRKAELETLKGLLAEARGGSGRVAFVCGEAGLGKTRLVRELREQIVDEPHVWLESGGAPHRQSTALAPVVDVLKQALAGAPDAAPVASGTAIPGAPAQQRLVRLEDLLRRAGCDLSICVPLFAPLLSLPVPDRYPAPDQDLPVQRRRMMEGLVAVMLAAAESQPVVLLLEDLHWADPSTLETLGLLLERVPENALLVVLTYRPGFNPPWPLSGTETTLELQRLGRDEAASLVDLVLQTHALPAAVRDQLVEKTGGVPLFAEQLTAAVLEANLDEVDVQVVVPATLRDSLMARLDRLGPHRELVQLAAVVGRQFKAALLAAATGRSPRAVESALGAVSESGLVERGSDGVYAFHHALVRDAAYESLLRGQRRQAHERVAHALSAAGDAQPERLAYHFQEAERLPEAIRCRLAASEQASRRLAMTEAGRHVDIGFDLLGALPHGLERDRLELDLQLARSAVLQPTVGLGAEAVGVALERALVLAGLLGSREHELRVLAAKSGYHQFRGEYEASCRAVQRQLSAAQGRARRTLRVYAYSQLGHTLLNLGRYTEALEAAERSHEEYLPEENPTAPPGAFLAQAAYHALRGLCLWPLGRPDDALAAGRRAVEVTRACTPIHYPTLCYAQNGLNSVLTTRRDFQEARAQAQATAALGMQHGYALWIAQGNLFASVARVHLGEVREAAEALAKILALYDAAGAGLLMPYFTGLLAEAQGLMGEVSLGLRTLERAQAIASRQHDGYSQPELARLRGELLLRSASPNRKEAEASLRQAVQLAEEQQATGWQLRAETSLARLLADQGLRQEALDRLATTYARFDQGFAGPDLRDARALLDSLA